MVKIFFWGLFLFLVTERLFELGRAKRNRKRIIEMGGREWGASHYPLFIIIHVLWFIFWPLEGMLKGVNLSPWWFLWLTIFISADTFRYWCMHLLGVFWNTRIMILPEARKINKGPYKFFSHPIYFAVSLILLSVPLIFQAFITATVISLANIIVLMFIRIPREKSALKTLE